ncbi:hypothetical protein [Natrinema pallidum]|uniref:Tyr recombinase domain-containing protein n=1 Tax=Natrinema pallidum DSM 3751 TaxID=1227495 RepID=L9ZCG3_9EURY|nr:hypothetical protein [Natrinema pallidum]ELY82848.1 hypothetical protein C487_01175 [Natrinema pallidum DSM 3751]
MERRHAREDRDPPALSPGDVRALAACGSLSERLLVIATCAWGLRRGEVAALSVDQFEPAWFDHFKFDADGPRIVFSEGRKNSPGRVSVLYGLETLDAGDSSPTRIRRAATCSRVRPPKAATSTTV